MDLVKEIQKPADALSAAVGDAQTLAREQVQAAWQLHMDRVREQLDAGWRESLERIFQDRYSEVEQKLREGFQSAASEHARQHIEAGLGPAVAAARRETAERLNNLARRLRAAESRDEVHRAVVDAAGEYASRAVFVEPDGAHQGAAVRNALESKDTVAAAATIGELGESLATHLGASPEAVVYLVPVIARDQALGVLCAVPLGEPANVNALELLASIAAPHLETPAAPVVVEAPPAKPGWSDLSRPEQETHLRAQRFARTRIAELVLNHISRVRDARQSRSLYAEFRNEIEAARQEFRREFFETCPSMVDYLHLELVRTLAKDEADALGTEYPGPLA